MTIDPNAPAPVEIDTPLDLTVNTTGHETVTGTGEPGGVVRLVTNSSTDHDFGQILVGADGRWSADHVDIDTGMRYVVAHQDVEWGPGMVTKSATRSGSTPATTQERGTVRLLSSRTVTLLADDTSTTTVSSTSQTVRLLRAAAATPAVAPPTVLTPTEGQVLAGNRPTITGTGEPGATITVLDSAGNVLGVALVAADGTWSLVPASPLPVGTTSIRAVQTLADGTAVGTSEVRSFVVPQSAAGAPLPTDPTLPTAPGAPAPGTAAVSPAPSSASSAQPAPATAARPVSGSATTARAASGSASAVKAAGAAVTRLARTGADAKPLGIGIALLLLGIGAIVAARTGRRRRPARRRSR